MTIFVRLVMRPTDRFKRPIEAFRDQIRHWPLIQTSLKETTAALANSGVALMPALLDDEFTIPSLGPSPVTTKTDDKSDRSALADSMTTPMVTIDLNALRANFRLVRELADPASVAPVIKCDAYGLGAVPIARALIEHEQARSFFVAHAHEGQALRIGLQSTASAPDQPEIFVLNGPTQSSLHLYKEHRLTPILNSVQQATLWASTYPNSPAGLHVDTGMNRLGLAPEKIIAIKGIDNLSISLVMSHLACAGDLSNPMNARQRARFVSAATQFPGVRLSLSSSGGGLGSPGYHYSQIRLGLSLYGGSVGANPDKRLKPVATLSAPIIQIREIKRGDTVGYDATWTATRNSRLASLAIGYGDGVPRAVSNRGAVALDGQIYPIVGRVSMDLITIDITDAPSGIAVGDRAELFGKRLAIEKMAEAADTVTYELLTRLGPRVIRRYHEG